MSNPSSGRPGSSSYAGIVVAAILLAIAGTAAVLLGLSGETKLAPVQASVPFQIVQPVRLPAGLTLENVFASPPPPQVQDGIWMVQLYYAPGFKRGVAPRVTVWEQWRASGIGAVLPSQTAQSVRLTAKVTGELQEEPATSRNASAFLSFDEAGRAFAVIALRTNVSELIQVARSLASSPALDITECASCGTAKTVASVPRGSGWISTNSATSAAPGTRFEIVPAAAVPGGTGRCAGDALRYFVSIISGMRSGNSGPVSGVGGIAAYNPKTCQVAVAWLGS